MLRYFDLREIADQLHQFEAEGEDAVPQMVDFMLQQGLQLNASDIHLECKKDAIILKFRIDGMLHPLAPLSTVLKDNLLARLKNLSRVMSYKRRLPQDGSIEFTYDGANVMLRSSFVPTLHGEKVVIRLPDESRRSFEIETLGLSPDLQEKFLQLLAQLKGTILLTGPSSSGKSTTIYSILKRIVSQHKDRINIATIEDPIEADLEEINQTQLDVAGGLTYASALKAILRQDPNVIVIGEIRDEETAHIAIQAGLSGHLVISTVHSGEAIGVFSRLLNMGIEPFLIASSISGVIAQRLVRRICQACAKDYQPTAAELMTLFLSPDETYTFKKSEGCLNCHYTGYKGRIGIFELLIVSDNLRELILTKASRRQIQALTKKEGMKTLYNDAIEKLKQGITSIEEIQRLALSPA